MKHTWYKCEGRCDPDRHCVYCDGGLASCTVCKGAEGSLPTECPGVRMTAQQQEDVYLRGLDFKDGKWVEKS